MKLIDSHCHLQYDFAPKSTADLVQEARAAGVDALIAIGTDLDSIAVLEDLSRTHPEIFYTVGVHPHETQKLITDFGRIAEAGQAERCVGIGELGIDYFYDHADRDSQLSALSAQLAIARALRKPVVIHSRDGQKGAVSSAESDLLPLLRDHAAKIEHPAGVIHCFTGTKDFAQACVKLGYSISFSGILTFKSAENLREIAADLPLESLLVETDSPYLAPVPYRGRKCEPSMVVETARVLAKVRGMNVEALALATRQNTIRLFSLPLL